MKDRLENSGHCEAYFARGDGSEIIEGRSLKGTSYVRLCKCFLTLYCGTIIC